MRRVILAIALLAGVSTQAHAQSEGFFGGLADGFMRGRALRLRMEQAEANSPAGQCIAMQAARIMRQKKLAAPDIVHAQMDAARAYCREAFGG
jgi:hypothetical protein